MFWSLILEPGKQYSSTVGESFHLSMATLDVKSVKNASDVFPVQLQIDKEHLILCNLSKTNFLQVNLDLIFQKGMQITFYTPGQATIHLTGYIIEDDLTSSVSSSEDDFKYEAPLKKKNAGKLSFKEKDNKNSQPQKNASKQDSPNKRKLEPENAPVKKKAKPADMESTDDEDDDSTETDDGLGDLENLSMSGSDEDEDDGDDDEEDEDDDGDEDEDDTLGTTFDDLNDDDEEDDDDEDDESDESEDEKPKKSPQTPQPTPKKKQNEQKTPTQNAQTKTPISSKKDKQGKQNQTIANGVTPKSEKKEKNKNTPQQQQQQQQKQKNANKGNETPGTPQKRTVEGGVVIEDLKVGNGPVAKPGRMLAVYYTGRLKSNNRVFDQSNSGPGFKFRLGRQEVIKGWDVGLAGMKVGSKRRITCPAAMAYGAKGSPPSIPPNSTLVFEVELKSVN